MRTTKNNRDYRNNSSSNLSNHLSNNSPSNTLDNIIVGVDPGTTTGYAILNLRTKRVDFGSSRNLGLRSLIRLLLDKGFVVLIGCDKKPCPRFVEDLASRLGVNLVVPRENLSEEQKKKLSSGFDYDNDHERDAIAALMIAHKRVKPLLKKVEVFVKHKIREEPWLESRIDDGKLQSIIRLVLFGKSIDEAFSTTIGSVYDEKEEVREKVGKGKEEKGGLKRNLLLKALNSEINLLKQEIKNLRLKNRELKKLVKELMLRINTNPQRKRLNVLENSIIKELRLENERLRKDNEFLLLENERLKNGLRKDFMRLLSSMQGRVFVPRFKNLIDNNILRVIKDLEGFGKDRTGRVNKINFVFVDNPNEYSIKVINELKERGVIVLTNKKPSDKVKGLLRITTIKRSYFEDQEFLIIDKEEIDKVLNKQDFLEKLVEDYKRERKERGRKEVD